MFVYMFICVRMCIYMCLCICGCMCVYFFLFISNDILKVINILLFKYFLLLKGIRDF